MRRTTVAVQFLEELPGFGQQVVTFRAGRGERRLRLCVEFLQPQFEARV
jgi:hypothetical protein